MWGYFIDQILVSHIAVRVSSLQVDITAKPFFTTQSTSQFTNSGGQSFTGMIVILTTPLTSNLSASVFSAIATLTN